MTLPNERTRAVYRTEDFLVRLLNAKTRPKTVKELKDWAYACLRHYPTILDLMEPGKMFDPKEARREFNRRWKLAGGK